jgi:hypothetical protein
MKQPLPAVGLVCPECAGVRRVAIVRLTGTWSEAGAIGHAMFIVPVLSLKLKPRDESMAFTPADRKRRSINV